MVAEGVEHDGLVVLAADRQHVAPVAQGQDIALELLKGLSVGVPAESDALQPVVADDPAPQRIVEVEDQNLGDPALAGRHEASGSARDRGQDGVGTRVFRRVPEPLVEELGSAQLGRQVHQIVDDAIRAGRHGLGQQGIELDHAAVERLRRHQAEIAEHPLDGKRKGVQHHDDAGPVQRVRDRQDLVEVGLGQALPLRRPAQPKKRSRYFWTAVL